VPGVHPYLDVEGPLGMAHRGFSLDGLENTMAAFGAAVALGATHVETDVHATRDGRLVAFHDPLLNRVTEGRGAITALTWAEVRQLRVRGREPVPLLEDVLEAWPQLRVNVDVKDWPAVAPVADVLRRTDALDRVCVASFDDRRTAAVRRLLGADLGRRLATAPGRRGVARWRVGSAVPGARGVRAARPGADGHIAVQVPVGAGPLRVVTRRSIDVAHRLGLHVHVWTVDDADTMNRLLDLGVDGLISDRADVLQRVLRERRTRAR
jgi:glycerophosphoryl diester phosphodiesterase